MASGDIYPTSQIEAGFSASASPSVLAAITDGNIATYAFSWTYGERMGFAIPIPPMPAGEGLSQLSLSVNNGSDGDIQVDLLNNGVVVVSDAAAPTWTPARPVPPASLNLAMRITNLGSTGNPTAGPFARIYEVGLSWVSARGGRRALVI